MVGVVCSCWLVALFVGGDFVVGLWWFVSFGFGFIVLGL